MNLKIIIFTLISVLIIAMLIVYYFHNAFGERTALVLTLEKNKTKNNNFWLNENASIEAMFYPNMRFLHKEISYRISDKCSIKKRDEARRAFEILENKTILNFFETYDEEQIFVACQDIAKPKGDLFVAGEGGPTNISKIGSFYIINKGKVLLIRESNCHNPNIAIHEILHVLGFKHSENPNNIMYNITKCSQTIGEDIPYLINKIYSIPNLPDLSIENFSQIVHNRYLDMNLTVQNIGLNKSREWFVNIYLDETLLEKISLPKLNIGQGIRMEISNLKINRNFNKLKIIVEHEFEELDKKNNEIVFVKNGQAEFN